MLRDQAVWALLIGSAVACRRQDTPANDSAVETTRVESAITPSSRWAPELGQLLVVPGDSDNTGVVLFPASPAPGLVSAAPMILVTASGDTLSVGATLVDSDTAVCGEAPTVRFSREIPSEWSVGLRANSATLVRLDSIEALPQADSSRLATELARLASSLPKAGDSRFTALPFVVVSARRLEVQQRHIVAAHLRRRLPQEATPLEEHTFVIAERPVSPSNSPYVLAFHERSEGTEETADHYDVLAVLTARPTTLLLLSREQDARSSYAILERTNTGAWRTRWTRTLAC